MTGSYEQLLSWVVFADWIFFGLTVAGLFVLRRGLGRPHRLPHALAIRGCPAFFVAVAVVVVYLDDSRGPEADQASARCLLLAGMPVYYLVQMLHGRADRRP